jgi:hypothetical protein
MFVAQLGVSHIPTNCLQNPLQFSFPPEVDEESLMQGAEQLSKAVLQSGAARVIVSLIAD